MMEMKISEIANNINHCIMNSFRRMSCELQSNMLGNDGQKSSDCFLIASKSCQLCSHPQRCRMPFLYSPSGVYPRKHPNPVVPAPCTAWKGSPYSVFQLLWSISLINIGFLKTVPAHQKIQLLISWSMQMINSPLLRHDQLLTSCCSKFILKSVC